MVEVTTTPPGKDLLLLEWRALAELWGLAAVWPHLALITPRGDGHPVLVLPGLISDDKSTL